MVVPLNTRGWSEWTQQKRNSSGLVSQFLCLLRLDAASCFSWCLFVITALFFFPQAVWQYLVVNGEPGDFHAAALPVPRGAAANSAAQELPACGWKHGSQVSLFLALQS